LRITSQFAFVDGCAGRPEKIFEAVERPVGLPECTHSHVGRFPHGHSVASGDADRLSRLPKNMSGAVDALSGRDKDSADEVEPLSGLPENMPGNVGTSGRSHQDQPGDVGRLSWLRRNTSDEPKLFVAGLRRAGAMGSGDF